MSNELYKTLGIDSQYTHKGIIANAFDEDQLATKDAFDTGQAGVNNEQFGAVLYNQLNLTSNMYGVLPKYDAMASAGTAGSFRAVSDRLTLEAMDEGADLPADERFDALEVNPEAKVQATVVAETLRHSIKSQIEDGVPMDSIRPLAERQIIQSIEREGLGRGVAGSNSGSPTPAYDSDNAITPLDRVIASGAEEGNADDINGNLFADGDLDVYGMDRSAGEFEAVVDYATSDRTLSESLMKSFIESVLSNGSGKREDYVILTGHDSARVLTGLDDKVRFVHDTSDADREQVNDAESKYGVGTAPVSDFDGIPIVESQNVPAHGSISDVFLLNLTTAETEDGEARPRIAVENYGEPIVREQGITSQDGKYAVSDLKNRVVFAYAHELVCHDPASQGKLRDLTE